MDEKNVGTIAAYLEPDASLLERPVAAQPCWEGRIFRVEKLEVELPDGSNADRELVWHHGGAGVCAVRDGKMCLVRQYRVALGRMTLEIPAGKLEEGEDPAVCAARELAEEAGLSAERLEPLAVSAGSPGFTNEATRVFLAHGLTVHPAHPDPDEFVDTVWVPVSDVLAAVQDGRIQDAKTIVSALWARVKGLG